MKRENKKLAKKKGGIGSLKKQCKVYLEREKLELLKTLCYLTSRNSSELVAEMIDLYAKKYEDIIQKIHALKK